MWSRPTYSTGWRRTGCPISSSFAVSLIFAASFFGAFEIVLPEKLVNDSDAKRPTRRALRAYSSWGADAGAGVVLVYGPHRGFGAHSVDLGRVLDADHHHAGLLGGFALPFTLFRAPPVGSRSCPRAAAGSKPR